MREKIQRGEGSSAKPREKKKGPITYLGMTQGNSYAFVDLPSESAATITNNIAALGWSVGGVHPDMNSPDIPPVMENYIRVWGINWLK